MQQIRPNSDNKEIVFRLTAIWAFNEAALGGMLHALKIPFTGLFVGGAAVVLISLIAVLSEKKGSVFRSALIVLLVKGIIAPHTPIAAYFSVTLQALLGELFFFSKRNYKLSAFALAVITSIFSAFQKIFVLTVLFGKELWSSIDSFAIYIAGHFSTVSNADLFPSFSFVILTGYTFIHLLGGILFGAFAAFLPGKLDGWAEKYSTNISNVRIMQKNGKEINPKKKRKKYSHQILFGFIALFGIISYFDLGIPKNKFYDAALMFVRSTAIIILWFFIAAPLIMKFIKNIFARSENKYKNEVQNIIELFPLFRGAFTESKKFSSDHRGFRKISTFISLYLTLLLFSEDAPSEEHIHLNG